MSKFAGKGGRIKWAAQNLRLKEWSIDHKGDDLDTTTFEDFNAVTGSTDETGLIGVEVAEGSARGDWDSTLFTDDPPGIYPREDGGPVLLFPNVAAGDSWNLPVVRVLSSRNTNSVRGLVGFECSFKSNGAFTLP